MKNPHNFYHIYSIFVAMIFLLPISLFSQNEKISVPSILITGKANSIEDSLKSKLFLNDYWSLKDDTKFEYSYKINPEFKNYIKVDAKKNIGYIKVSGGNNFSLKFDSVFQLVQNPFLIFATEFFNQEIESGWRKSSLSLHWLPKTQGKIIDSGVFYKQIETELSDDSQTTISGFDFGFINEIQETDLLKDMALNIKLSGTNYKQQNDDNSNEKKEIDFVGSSVFSVKKIDLNVEIAPSFLKNNFSLQSSGYFSNFFFIDKLGLWLVYDKEDLYPSLIFSKKSSINYNTDFIIENSPFIETKSRRNELAENEYLSIKDNFVQEKNLLNFFTGFKYYNFISFDLLFNSAYICDYHLYMENSDSLYYFIKDDLWVNRILLKAYLEVNNFHFNNSFIYQDSGDNNIPYLSKFENIFTTSYSTNKWETSLDFCFLSGRRNHHDIAMDDDLLLNLRGTWKFSKNLILSLEAENLLNQNYLKYENIPEEKLQVEMEILWKF